MNYFTLVNQFSLANKNNGIISEVQNKDLNYLNIRYSTKYLWEIRNIKLYGLNANYPFGLNVPDKFWIVPYSSSFKSRVDHLAILTEDRLIQLENTEPFPFNIHDCDIATHIYFFTDMKSLFNFLGTRTMMPYGHVAIMATPKVSLENWWLDRLKGKQVFYKSENEGFKQVLTDLGIVFVDEKPAILPTPEKIVTQVAKPVVPLSSYSKEWVHTTEMRAILSSLGFETTDRYLQRVAQKYLATQSEFCKKEGQYQYNPGYIIKLYTTAKDTGFTVMSVLEKDIESMSLPEYVSQKELVAFLAKEGYATSTRSILRVRDLLKSKGITMYQNNLIEDQGLNKNFFLELYAVKPMYRTLEEAIGYLYAN